MISYDCCQRSNAASGLGASLTPESQIPTGPQMAANNGSQTRTTGRISYRCHCVSEKAKIMLILFFRHEMCRSVPFCICKSFLFFLLKRAQFIPGRDRGEWRGLF